MQGFATSVLMLNGVGLVEVDVDEDNISATFVNLAFLGAGEERGPRKE